MKVLISEKLSEHKYKTPEGYLICTDAILARTGKQSYTKDELFQDGDNTEVNVDRPYDEVMNAKTIASFENKPITFDHPDEDVNVGNYKDYAIGYVRDVHQGKTDKGEDVILGNLVITDQDAINAIEQGDHTDLSCGYDCDIRDDGSGNYSQTNIRGNHLALCEQGRAGIAHIVDSKVEDSYVYLKRRTLSNVEFTEAKKLGIKVDTDYYNDETRLSASNWQKLDDFLGRFDLYRYAGDIKDSIKDSLSHADVEQIEKAIRAHLHYVPGALTSKHIEYILFAYTDLPAEKIKEFVRGHGIRSIKEMGWLDSKVKDDNLLGKKVRIRKRYSNLDGTIGTIYSYEGTNYDDEVEVKRNGHIYKVNYEDIEFLDSKVKDSLSKKEKELCDYMLENALDDGEDENDLLKKMKLYYSEYSNLARSKPNEVLRYFKSHIDNEIEDAGWKTTKMASGIIHELGNMRIIEEENEKGDIQYRIGGTNGQVFSSLEKAKNAIRRKHLDEIEDNMNYSEEMKAVRNALQHIVVDNKSEMKQLIQDLIDNKPMNYSLEVRRLKRAIDELIKWSDNRQEGIDTIWAIAKENRIVDSKVEDNMNDAKDSKEMTMSDAIKMLNIVDAYKKAKTFTKDSYIVVRYKSDYEDAARKLGLTIEKDSKSLRIYGDRYKLKQLQNQFDNDEEISYVVIKDASKDKWVIKNTGLAYEIWNQGKMVKKFPTKKLAIEWIHSRFPTDEIIEDSTKDSRLWQTLTRKAKH